MTIIKQIFIILLFYIIGEIMSQGIFYIVPIFIPGSIIGMLLLLTALLTKKIKIEAVDDVGSFLTNNMAFFFIPVAVSVLEYYHLLEAVFIWILLIITISLVVSFFAIAYVVRIISIFQEKRGEEHA